MSRFARVLLALGVSLVSAPAFAGAGVGVNCPDRQPSVIPAPLEAARACQKAIAKEGAKFVKTKTGALSKCLLKSEPGACPSADDTTKIEQAAVKAAEKISKACADDAAQDALGSSYGALADDTVISSCTLSQHNASAQLLVDNATGVSTEAFPGEDDKARKKCVSEANKTGVKYALDTLAAMNKCLEKQLKAGVTSGLEAACVGAWDGGAFVVPSDAKTGSKLVTLREKAIEKVAKKCAAGEGSWLPSVFACGGAATTAELQECLVCEGWNSAVDLLEQQYAETGSFVENGPGAIETAVNAAAPGAKLLIESGEYRERVTLEVEGLQLVGCGGATGNRPRLERPETCALPEDCARGIFAAGLSDLLFQSLEVVNWDDDGIFVSEATNVTFRDIIGDGQLNSTYAVFPVTSDGVVVEGCDTRNVIDAAIYVGQSENILVRHNRVTGSVAGIEIENSAFADVHNNFATGNTGGILVFKAASLPVQFSNDHVVSHNVLVDNNAVNVGSGTVAAVPDGTGMLIISTDDSLFEYNVITGNNSFGIGFIDQRIVEQTESPDQKATGNTIRKNVATGNALSPDTTGENATPLASDIVIALGEFNTAGVQDHGNCVVDNTDILDILFFPNVIVSQCPVP